MAKQRRRGSAMIIAVVVVLILMAIAAALMTEVWGRSKEAFTDKQIDEATIVCRTGLERARRALYDYRANRTWDLTLVQPTPIVVGDAVEQWNDILAYCVPTNPDVTSTDKNKNKYFPSTTTTMSDYLKGVKDNWTFVNTNTQFTSYYGDREKDDAAITYNLAVTAGADAPPKIDPDNRVLFGQSKPFRGGSYHITIRDNTEIEDLVDGASAPFIDHDRVIICTVTAILEDGTMRQIEATLSYTPPTFIPAQALLSGGEIVVSGSAQIMGSSGNIFADGNLTFGGSSSTVSGTSQAAGSVSGAPATGSAPVGGQTPVQIPNVSPSDLAASAKVDKPLNYYLFDSSGFITKPDGTKIDASGGGSGWYGFKFQNGAWSLSGNDNPDAVAEGVPDGGFIFHFQTDFTMTGQGNASSLKATWLVEGNADMGGNRLLEPFYSNTVVMASLDLVIRGTSGNVTTPGLYAAHEQVSIQGTPDIYGAVIAQDAQNSSTKVDGITGSDLTTGGNPSVTYNGGLSTGLKIDSLVRINNVRRTYPK